MGILLSLAYSDGKDFPKTINLDNPSSTKISSNVLSKAINSTIFASGNDDLRPVMSGVFFQFSTENLTFVATDAHKLVKYSRTDLKASNLAEFIMPKKPLNLIKNFIDDDYEVTIEYNNSNHLLYICVLTSKNLQWKTPSFVIIICDIFYWK